MFCGKVFAALFTLKRNGRLSTHLQTVGSGLHMLCKSNFGHKLLMTSLAGIQIRTHCNGTTYMLLTTDSLYTNITKNCKIVIFCDIPLIHALVFTRNCGENVKL